MPANGVACEVCGIDYRELREGRRRDPFHPVYLHTHEEPRWNAPHQTVMTVCPVHHYLLHKRNNDQHVLGLLRYQAIICINMIGEDRFSDIRVIRDKTTGKICEIEWVNSDRFK